jgi:hypothetical protein
MKTIYKLFALMVACGMAYQSYASFRSALANTQPHALEPNNDTKAILSHVAAILSGVVSLTISIIWFWYVIEG